MTSALLLSLLLTADPTRADVIGALNLLENAVVAIHNGSTALTVTGTTTRRCVTRNTGVPSGVSTLRFGVIVLSARVQYELGFGIPADVPTVDPVDGHTLSALERWTLTGERYAIMEIQSIPTEEITFDVARMNEHLDMIREELDTRTSPVFPTCEIAAVRADDSAFGTAVRCACAKSTLCKKADNVTAAPLGVTLYPGTFTPSTACQAKPCVTRFDGAGIDKTWPAVCPK